MCVLPLRGISSWRQGRGDPLRHTTTHRDTEVSLDSPSASSAQPPTLPPAPPCFPFPDLDAHHVLVNSLSLASNLNHYGFFLPPLHPPTCSTVVLLDPNPGIVLNDRTEDRRTEMLGGSLTSWVRSFSRGTFRKLLVLPGSFTVAEQMKENTITIRGDGRHGDRLNRPNSSVGKEREPARLRMALVYSHLQLDFWGHLKGIPGKYG